MHNTSIKSYYFCTIYYTLYYLKERYHVNKLYILFRCGCTMIDGLILGVITWISLVFSFQHLPLRLKTFLLSRPLVCDIMATGICFIFLSSISKSILSVVGSIVCGLLINFTLIIYRNFIGVDYEINEKQNEKHSV